MTTPQLALARLTKANLAKQSQMFEIVPEYITDLQNLQTEINQTLMLFKAGSMLGKALGMVNYVLDKLKSIGWGVSWKLVSKTIPPIAIL